MVAYELMTVNVALCARRQRCLELSSLLCCVDELLDMEQNADSGEQDADCVMQDADSSEQDADSGKRERKLTAKALVAKILLLQKDRKIKVNKVKGLIGCMKEM